MNTKSTKRLKTEIRNTVKYKLSRISTESLLRQSRFVYECLKQIPEFENARKVALFMNTPTMEIQTDKIIKFCFNAGKEVFLPKCNYDYKLDRKKNHLSMLKVPTYADVLKLEPQGKYKLLEPVEGLDALDTDGIDLIVLPGVAFSRQGERLGHGAGFYDEFLTHYQNKFKTVPFLIGIGLHEQLVDNIPVEQHDWRADCLIIGNIGLIR